MATIVTMYTLRRSADGTLEGPINKKVYASYAPKRHAVAIARREANKRGFGPGSGKLIQIVTDGDNDLQCYIEELFPEAIHTIDVYHVTEYLWEAGQCLYREGSVELVEWVETQKEALYDGRAAEIVAEIDKRLAQLDPGQQSVRKRLQKARNYIDKRVDKMNYKKLREQDLEISSGAVEGAVNYVIAKRFDSGGMRWIKERAEHLLQLRCRVYRRM
ncbi:MAG: transposase, partial [Anaerolineales bacterium]|nr:transposase [Anaerolineales bacterium]